MMKFKHIILIIFLILEILTLSGCKSIIVKSNTPLIVKETSSPQNEDKVSVKLLGFYNLTPGLIKGLSINDTELLVLNTTTTPPITNTVDLYSLYDSKITTNLISSEKKEWDARYDLEEKGVFYVQEDTESSGNPATLQLFWTSLDKSSTRTISLPEESVSHDFCLADNNRVIYTNNQNEVILADIHGRREIFNNTDNYTITHLSYNSEKNKLYFIGQLPKDEKKKNLYEVSLDGVDLKPNSIDSDIINYDYNPQTKSLSLIKSNEDRMSIYTYNEESNSTKRKLLDGFLEDIFFSKDGNYIYYTQSLYTRGHTLKSIWRMDKDGKNRLQITSPLPIVSELFIDNSNQSIYFSIDGSMATVLKLPAEITLVKINYEVIKETH